MDKIVLKSKLTGAQYLYLGSTYHDKELYLTLARLDNGEIISLVNHNLKVDDKYMRKVREFYD